MSKPAAPAGAAQRAVAAARESRGDAPDEGDAPDAGAALRKWMRAEQDVEMLHAKLRTLAVPVAAPRKMEAEGDDELLAEMDEWDALLYSDGEDDW